MSGASIGLDALAARLRDDLAILQSPPADWVKPRHTESGARVADVTVVGAGMCGLAASFALRRAGIDNIRILDAGATGQEGPWVTYARMETLRSPKSLAGPALGLPSLAFRSWYEAQWGREAWLRLGKIPRTMWMDYLIWYRTVLDLPVENMCRVTRIVPQPHGFDLEVDRSGEHETIASRRVVLATGREGMACPRVPAPLEPLLGPRCLHSSQAIDFSQMRGAAIAVIGFSAAAVDNAAEALEAGADSVHLLVRAEAVPRINKMKSTAYPGFTHGFPSLDPRMRLALLSYVMRYRMAPPRESVLRVFRHPNARLHLGCEVTDAVRDGDRLTLQAGEETLSVDYVIYCTGFSINTLAPPETREFAGAIRTFRDSIADADVVDELLDFPDLGPAFEFQERSPGSAPFLAGLHNFTYAATVSHGNVSGDIPCVSDGAERLARGIAAALFAEDFPDYLGALEAYEEPELLGDEIPGAAKWNPPV